MLTFGMGIALAIGTISVFESYQSQIISTATDKQVEQIQSEVRNTVFHLKQADSGHMTLDLPSDIGGSDYSVSLYEGVAVSLNRQTYHTNFSDLNREYDFEGTVEGGTVKMYKQQNEPRDKLILRPG